MRSLRNAFVVFLTVVFVGSFAGISFAHGKDHEAFVKLLNDSAMALQSSNPALAAELTKFSTEEANEKEENGEKKELEGKEENEMHEHHEAHLKLLRDSAAALKASHPDLAADLTKKADRSEKKTKEHKEGKEDSKEMKAKEGK